MADKTDYTKRPLTPAEQVARLKQRGLVFDDENEAIAYLFNISYYRLRAYTYPFQENGEDSEHNFTRKDIHFKDIIDLYCFDRRLRSLIFNAIEKIEVAVRTKIVQVYAESTGDSHWFNDESLYRFGYDDLMKHIEADVNRSNEDFIKHYKSKYNNPPMPPSWMALEVVSFTTLSRLFQSLKLDNRKEYITEQFGLKKVAILENWLHAISNLRNCCAHHSRVWNRRFMVSVTLPYNTLYPFMDRTTIGQIRTNKLFVLILSVPEATLKGISKNCSNPTAVCLTLKIWDSPNTGNRFLFGEKNNKLSVLLRYKIVYPSVPVALDSSNYRVCCFYLLE